MIHVGQFGEQPGGMAQVVNVYRGWSSDELKIIGWRTTRGKHDPFAPLLTTATIFRTFFSTSRHRTLMVVHLSQGGSWLREGLVLRIAAGLGWRCVAQIHGSGFIGYADRNTEQVRKVLSSAKRVYVLSDEAQRAVKDLGPTVGKVDRIRNVVDVPSVVTKEKLIVFGGAVGLRKGADTLFSAWAKAHAVLPGWKLSVAGPSEADFEPYALDGLELHGTISNRELGDVLSRAIVAILPSRAEALPMFLLEAMAHGAVPIATDVGQVAELLDGVGVIVPAGDIEALAAALVATCLNPRLKSLSDIARSRVLERYSSDTQREILIEKWRRDFAG